LTLALDIFSEKYYDVELRKSDLGLIGNGLSNLVIGFVLVDSFLLQEE